LPGLFLHRAEFSNPTKWSASRHTRRRRKPIRPAAFSWSVTALASANRAPKCRFARQLIFSQLHPIKSAKSPNKQTTTMRTSSSIPSRIASFSRQPICPAVRRHYPLGADGPVVSPWRDCWRGWRSCSSPPCGPSATTSAGMPRQRFGIDLYTSLPDVHIGDTIFYSVLVANAPFPACDAGETNPASAGAIKAFVVTPMAPPTTSSCGEPGWPRGLGLLYQRRQLYGPGPGHASRQHGARRGG